MTVAQILPGAPDQLVFTGIPSNRCEEFWDRVDPVLWRAIVRTDGRHSSLSTKHAIQNQQFQLWVAFEDASMRECVAALVTQISTYPTGVRECEIVFCAGDVVPRCLPLLELIEAWAKSADCTAIALTGRRGWARILNSNHFEESATVLRKRI